MIRSVLGSGRVSVPGRARWVFVVVLEFAALGVGGSERRSAWRRDLLGVPRGGGVRRVACWDEYLERLYWKVAFGVSAVGESGNLSVSLRFVLL